MQPCEQRSLSLRDSAVVSKGAWPLILLVALLLRLPGYGESVWIDELYTSDLFCGQPIVLFKTLYSDIHPPAYFLFIHVWNRLFGDGELWLRLPALLSGLASVLLVGKLAARYVDRVTGWVAGGLLACSPVHIWYSQEARPYSTAVCLVLAALAALATWHERPERKRYGWGFGLALLAAVFLHYYLAVFPLFFAAHAWRYRRSNWRKVCAICGMCLGLLAIYMAAKLYFSDVPTAKGYLRAFGLREAWELGAEWFLTGLVWNPVGGDEALGGWLLALFQVLAAPVFLRGLWRLGRTGGGLLIGCMLALPLFLFGLPLLGLDQTYIERSALPSLPLFWIVMAAGLTGWRRARSQCFVWSASVLAIVAVLASFFWRGDAWTVYKPNPDWRSAAAWVGERVDTKADSVLVSDYVSPTALSYYDPRIQEAKNFELNTGKIEGMFAKAGDLFGERGVLGGWIQGFLRGQLDRYSAHLERLRQQARVRIHELAVVEKAELEVLEPTFLLIYRSPTERASAILSDPRARQLESESFRSLTLYHLAWNAGE